jgi:pantoate kinase
MEFDEVSSYIYRDARQVPTTLDYDQPILINSNTYDSLIPNRNQSTHQLATRKPTLSNFVNRLKQQSSRTRFAREYKRITSALDQQHSHPAYLTPDDGTIHAIHM